jgi:branched-chain amino acid transport system permease protein
MPSLGEWSAHLVIGLSFGLLLFLLASGFTLTFGLARFVNLAHGAVFLVSSYTAAEVADDSGSFALGLLAAVVVGTMASCALYFLARLRWSAVSADILTQVLFSFGVLLILSELAQMRWKGLPKSMPIPSGLEGSVGIGGVTFPVYRFFVMGAALVLAAGIYLLQNKTRFGALVRAGVDDRESLEAMGVRTEPLSTAVFALSGALAGAAAGLGAPVLGASMGQEFSVLVFALVVVVLGGLGSLGGAFLASIAVGLSDAVGKALIPQFGEFTMMALVVIVLGWRPAGLFGRSSR